MGGVRTEDQPPDRTETAPVMYSRCPSLFRGQGMPAGALGREALSGLAFPSRTSVCILADGQDCSLSVPV